MFDYIKWKSVWIFLPLVLFIKCINPHQVTQSVNTRFGAINGVFIERNGKTLVIYGDPNDEIKKAEMILFTHFRRDVIWAGQNLVQKGSHAVVPEKEKGYFTNGDSIWSNYVEARFHDYSNQTTKIGILPTKVNQFVRGGEILKWQDLEIKVLETPGYTRGSVSYIMDIDRKRIAFVGDLIYGDGKLFDLYSFQDSIRSLRGYHGYAARLGQLVSSLQLIAEQKPDFLIPSRGPIITDPNYSIQSLIKKVQLLYRNFLSISAIRYGTTERINILTDHVLGPGAEVDFMPFSSIAPENQPSWYVHINNTKLVFAEDSSAFLLDCGTTKERVFNKVLEMKHSGRLKRLDGIFITHYHDDHVDFINEFIEEFGCPVYITEELKDIIENPSAYKMPALTTSVPITKLKIVQNGEKMSWKDFILTFYYFPGQTLYHDAVLFEKSNGEAVFCAGDSFTASGIDDYCLLNRNFLRPGMGYLYCLDVLRGLPENMFLSHQHSAALFTFSRYQLDYMTNVLLERIELLKDLFPWDDVNYGLDEQWVKIYPYGLKVIPGQSTEFSVKIFNHSSESKTFDLKPNAPAGFDVEPNTASLVLAPMTEGERKFRLSGSKQIAPGVFLLTTNVKFDDWDLREWSEAVVEVSYAN